MLVFNGDAAIRKAVPEDLGDILAMYDEAVAWLNERGITEQWGTTPVTDRPHLVDEVAGLIDCGYVAESTEILGFLALNAEMPGDLLEYASKMGLKTGLYVHTLVAHRTAEARGAGALLLQYAEGVARNAGHTYVALSCWAGNPRLVRYYEDRGFKPFNAGDREQLFLKCL